jgi:hypothetical protein
VLMSTRSPSLNAADFVVADRLNTSRVRTNSLLVMAMFPQSSLPWLQSARRRSHTAHHAAQSLYLSLGTFPAQIPIAEPVARPTEAYLPRFRALALFGRRPPERVVRLSLPASENLHRSRHCEREFVVNLGERRCLRHLQSFELAHHRALRAALASTPARPGLRRAVCRRAANKRDQPRAARGWDHGW